MAILVGAIYLVVLVLCVPLATTAAFCSDEGFEIMKAALCAEGFELYTVTWSDQPPLHTKLLELLMRCEIRSVMSMRLVSVGFAACTIGLFFDIVQKISGRVVAWVASVLLVLSPHFIQQSVSATIIIPTHATALFSLWLVVNQERCSRRWVLLSGCAFAVALHIKLSAALFAPAIIFNLLSRSFHARPVWHVALWSLSTAATWAAIAWAVKLPLFDVILPAHFGEKTIGAFSWSTSLSHLGSAAIGDCAVWISALAGFFLARTSRKSFVPEILLVSVLLFHIVHVPYWWYHYINLSIPLCWLASDALVRIISALRHSRQIPGFLSLVACTLVFALVVHGQRNLAMIQHQVLDQEKIPPAPLGIDLSDATGSFVITKNSLGAYHSRVLVPPNLAVWSRKRVASGGISDFDLIRAVREFHPVFIDKNTTVNAKAFERFMGQHPDYVKVEQGFIRHRTSTEVVAFSAAPSILSNEPCSDTNEN